MDWGIGKVSRQVILDDTLFIIEEGNHKICLANWQPFGGWLFQEEPVPAGSLNIDCAVHEIADKAYSRLPAKEGNDPLSREIDKGRQQHEGVPDRTRSDDQRIQWDPLPRW